jgi:uncharacterized protein (TIGR03437 family)
MRTLAVLLLLCPCAIANPPLNFTFNAGVTCDGFCLGGGIQIEAVTIDSAGNTYLTGNVNLTTFPATPNAFQRTLTPSYCVGPPLEGGLPPCNDAFVVKLDPDGNIVWATYLGGNGDDYGSAIAVDAAGNVFVAGTSEPGESSKTANTFPVTSGAAFGPPAPDRAGYFVTKLSADGSRLLYSTFLPGTAEVEAPAGNQVALAIDSQGNAYLAYPGSPGIPTTPGAFQPATASQGPGVVVKLNPSGSALIYATYLSGTGGQGLLNSIAVDGSGNAVIAGSTQSANFPVTPGAFDTTIPSPQAGFVSKLNADGTALIYSTYFGSQAQAVKLDSGGDAYILAYANPSGFPSTSGSIPSGTSVPVVAHLSADGSALVYSIFVPGANSMDLDRVGNVYVAGTNPAATATVFVERLAPGGVLSGMETLGGGAVMNNGGPANDTAKLIAVAPNGSVVVSGTVVSTNFPGIPGPIPAGGVAYAAGFFINATVMNAANYTAGVVAPGEIVAILGCGFDITPTARVYFDEFAAPLIYESDRQVNAQVPWEIAGQSSTRITIDVAVGPMNLSTYGPFVVSVAPSVPGVFYVTNSDGSVNSAANPATRGDFVVIYGTGGGLTSPVGTTGGWWPDAPLASFTLPVTITIGGENAGVIYSGSAPTLLSGFFQVNVRIPADLAPSGSTPLVLNMGTGQTTVPVAIK